MAQHNNGGGRHVSFVQRLAVGGTCLAFVLPSIAFLLSDDPAMVQYITPICAIAVLLILLVMFLLP